MRKRKTKPSARVLRARNNRIADLNVSAIVQADFVIWINWEIDPDDSLAEGKMHLPKVFPIANNTHR